MNLIKLTFYNACKIIIILYIIVSIIYPVKYFWNCLLYPEENSLWMFIPIILNLSLIITIRGYLEKVLKF